MPSPKEPSLRKRRPNSDPSELTEQHPPTRSENWYDDGSVVLQAEDVQIKVHKSILVQYSSIFSDTFTMPQPAGKPTVDDCPLLHLYDSAFDLKHFLRALYGDP
mgnify:CR=1 FL=1